MPAPSIPQRWQPITNPNAGIQPVLDICGSALVALGGFPLGQEVAQTSVDHGATWQGSPLAGGKHELGDSGYYWRGKNVFENPPRTTDEETHDCGVTWIAMGPTLETCVGGFGPLEMWRAGAANSTLYAQGSAQGINQFVLCASLDGGQTWSPGPPLPPNAYVVAVRGGHWFANVVFGNPATSPDLLLRSDDDGQTWQSTGLYSATFGLSLIASTAQGAVMCIIATNQVPTAGAQSTEVLWQWNDARATWTASPPFPTAINQNMGIDALAANPTVPGQLFIAPSTGSVFESQDGGDSWFDAANGFNGQIIAQLVFAPTLANRLYANANAAVAEFFALDVSP
jgi:hypothetical protein